ncbi:MAG: hypothetical protein LBK29_00995 [Oscillospiraceae bacterium]|jgi:hypothetical protein|nr:hypothetical protein [Oscillospiraceae bacterium]
MKKNTIKNLAFALSILQLSTQTFAANNHPSERSYHSEDNVTSERSVSRQKKGRKLSTFWLAVGTISTTIGLIYLKSRSENAKNKENEEEVGGEEKEDLKRIIGIPLFFPTVPCEPQQFESQIFDVDHENKRLKYAKRFGRQSEQDSARQNLNLLFSPFGVRPTRKYFDKAAMEKSYPWSEIDVKGIIKDFTNLKGNFSQTFKRQFGLSSLHQTNFSLQSQKLNEYLCLPFYKNLFGENIHEFVSVWKKLFENETITVAHAREKKEITPAAYLFCPWSNGFWQEYPQGDHMLGSASDCGIFACDSRLEKLETGFVKDFFKMIIHISELPEKNESKTHAILLLTNLNDDGEGSRTNCPLRLRTVVQSIKNYFYGIRQSNLLEILLNCFISQVNKATDKIMAHTNYNGPIPVHPVERYFKQGGTIIQPELVSNLRERVESFCRGSSMDAEAPEVAREEINNCKKNINNEELFKLCASTCTREKIFDELYGTIDVDTQEFSDIAGHKIGFDSFCTFLGIKRKELRHFQKKIEDKIKNYELKTNETEEMRNASLKLAKGEIKISLHEITKEGNLYTIFFVIVLEELGYDTNDCLGIMIGTSLFDKLVEQGILEKI